jgi:ATP-dependent DNA helicase RecQ
MSLDESPVPTPCAHERSASRPPKRTRAKKAVPAASEATMREPSVDELRAGASAGSTRSSADDPAPAEAAATEATPAEATPETPPPLDPATEQRLEEAAQLARSVFGHDALRQGQREVLRHVLGGRDCLAVLPTGSGKSLCYGLPALAQPGLVVVVSPLVALMREQAERFNAVGLDTVAFDAYMGAPERERALARLDAGDVRLVLISPERLGRGEFRQRLAAARPWLVAIDEAHCISSWGGAFRPDYRQLGAYLEALGPVRRLALTATATARVRRDIRAALGMDAAAEVWDSVLRPNLELSVVRAPRVADQRTLLLNAVLSEPGAGIVYAPTRKDASEVGQMLGDAGVPVAVYHAGMRPEDRHASQRALVSGSVRVMVATSAFGLGIDLGALRFVHHAGMPGSLEQYVQEVGRAGRDGGPARCMLVYCSRDFHIQKFMLEKSHPTLEELAGVHALALRELDHGRVLDRGSLERRIRAERGDAGVAALTLLAREDVLGVLRPEGGGGGELLEAHGSVDAAAFFADYPERRHEAFAKLTALRAYAELPAEERTAALAAYFRA